MKTHDSFTGASVIAIAAAVAWAALRPERRARRCAADRHDHLGAGEKMGGVTVSAKAEGSTITTSVYTDEAGGYYFPPLPDGKYRVWAQALTFQTAKGNVDLTKTTHQDFSLQPMTNQEDWVRQLPGDEFLAALPGDTPEDYRMKTQVRKNCTGCHTASYPLQHRFDEDGWNKVLDLMKQVNVLGVYPRPDDKPTGNIEFHQKELADYLARARGPGETSMKFKLRPRPSGEAARVVVQGIRLPDGRRPPPRQRRQRLVARHAVRACTTSSGVHDAQMDFNGNIWFTYGHTSLDTTVAKIDGKTGAVKNFKLDDQRGIATGTHGITRDENGVMWFNTRSNVARAPWRSRPRRSQGRQGHGLSAAALDDRHRRHDRRRPQRQYLGDLARRRAALRHQGGEVHRVQVGDLQEPARHRDGLRPRRRPHRQRLVAADDART